MEKILQYAKQFNVPIINDEGLAFLLKTIEKHECTRILEIGSAIGYSAIQMALLNPNIHITTIEIDPVRYEQAKQNIERLQLTNQIELHLEDALVFETEKQFDFIFIDAAKAQYIKFFEKYEKNLVKNGVIFSDNLDFHGLVKQKEAIQSRNVRQLVRKIQNYIDYLKQNENYHTTFYEIGDGVSISFKLY